MRIVAEALTVKSSTAHFVRPLHTDPSFPLFYKGLLESMDVKFNFLNESRL